MVMYSASEVGLL